MEAQTSRRELLKKRFKDELEKTWLVLVCDPDHHRISVLS
jgi:hypothetical protein